MEYEELEEIRRDENYDIVTYGTIGRTHTIYHKRDWCGIVVAIICPPLAAYLLHGFRFCFWISLLLTFLFWIPGMVFTLCMVLQDDFD